MIKRGKCSKCDWICYEAERDPSFKWVNGKSFKQIKQVLVKVI